MLCSKLHCQKGFDLIPFSYKDPLTRYLAAGISTGCEASWKMFDAKTGEPRFSVPGHFSGGGCRRAAPWFEVGSWRDWYFIAEQPASGPHLAHPEECAVLHTLLVTVPCVSRACDHCPDGFGLHLLHWELEPFHRRARGEQHECLLRLVC